MKYFGYTTKNEVENKAWKIVDADEKTLGHVMLKPCPMTT